MRSVSATVPFVIAIAGFVAISAMLYALLDQSRLFPDTVAGSRWTITAYGKGETRQRALENLGTVRQRVEAFVQDNGVTKTPLTLSSPDAGYADYTKEWTASQAIQADVADASYSRIARLANRLGRMQEGRDDLAWGFPPIPFQNLAITLGVALICLLCFSVISLETREADVNHAPRGMHPVVVGAQTLTVAALLVGAVLTQHVLSELGGRVLIALLAIGVGSLCVWLYKTRAWWQQTRFLRISYIAYAVALACVALFGVAAALTPVI